MQKEIPIRYYDDNNKPPDPHAVWKLFIAIIVLIIAYFIFGSCNTVAHDQKKLNKINDRHPALMAQELNKLFPPSDSSDYSIGSIDTLPNDSAQYYKEQYQNALALKQKVKDSIVVSDTCQTIGDGDYDEGYNYGVQLGYAKGKSECKPSTVRVDTIYRTPSDVLAQAVALKSDTAANHDTIIKLTTQYNGEKNYKYWLFGLLVLIGVVSVLKIWSWIKGKLPIKMG